MEALLMNKLMDKILPMLIVACIGTTLAAYVELKELVVKVGYLEKTIEAYHEDH